jgi:hypothetical protein
VPTGGRIVSRGDNTITAPNNINAVHPVSDKPAVRISPEGSYDQLKLLWQVAIIRIEETNDLALTLSVGSIPSRSLPAILLSYQPDSRVVLRVFFNDQVGPVRRTIVAHDHFEFCVGLSKDALDCFAKERRIVIVRG